MTSKQPAPGVTQARETRAEAKNRVTDAASRGIIDEEVAAREKKTERLRSARLAEEERSDQPVTPVGRRPSKRAK